MTDEAPPPLLTLDQLDRLEDHWRRQEAPILEHLRPGLSDDEMDSLTDPLGLRLPTEARTWWGWRGGADIAADRPQSYLMSPDRIFYTVEHAVEQYRSARRLWEDIDPDNADYWWRPTWFPITYWVGYIRLDCDVEEGAATPIYHADSHDHDAKGLTEPRVPSFGVMMDWWLDAFECGAWCYDAEAEGWRYDYTLLPRERELTRLV